MFNLKDGWKWNPKAKTVSKAMISMVLVLCLLSTMLPTCVLPISAASTISELDGNGTEDNPYTISSADELLFMASKVNAGDPTYSPDKYYKLANDIDLTGSVAWTPIGNTKNPFTGTFNGNNAVVRGLNYSYTIDANTTTLASGGVGFFGVTNDGAHICDLSVEGDVKTEQYGVGGLIGACRGALELVNCHFTGTVQSGYWNYQANCGGLIGTISNLNNKTTIDKCTFNGTVTWVEPSISNSDYLKDLPLNSPENVGGLVGQIYKGVTVNITDSRANLTGLSGESGTGGLIGTINSAPTATDTTNSKTIVTVDRCYTEGEIFSTKTAGGLIGWARVKEQQTDENRLEITITDSYSVMDLTNATNASGLFGGVRSPSTPGDVKISISRCHFAGVNAKQPIMSYDSTLCTLETKRVYYRKGSVKNKDAVVPLQGAEEKTSQDFKDGVVRDLLNDGESVPQWVHAPHTEYPVLMYQKHPSLSKLKLGDDELDLTKLIHNKTVSSDVTSVVVTTETDDASDVKISVVNGEGNPMDCVNGEVSLTAGQTTTVTILVSLNGFEKTYTLSIYRNPIPWKGENDADNFTAHGSGTSTDPYKIATGAQLAYLSQLLQDGATYRNKYYELTADIDLNNQTWTPINLFSGTFNGANYAIRNLKVSGGESVGLFGSVSGTVKNLTVSGTASGTNNVGGIAGTATGATFENCDFHGTVSGEANVGGLVGAVFTGNTAVKKCGSADGSVFGNENVGGLVGSSNDTLTCENSYSVMKVEGTTSIGGLLGNGQSKDTFTYCHFAGTVSTNAIAPTGTKLTGVYAVEGSCTDTTGFTAAEFADGTVANVLGNAVWATSANGYPVPSNIAKDVLNAFIANDIAAEQAKEKPDYKKFATAYSTSIRAKESSQGIRFKFPLSKELKETVQSVVVLIAKQGSSENNIKESLYDEHLYAHSLTKGDLGYYQYLQAKAYTKGSSHNVALVDKSDYYQFAAALVNFKKELAVYEAQYIARAYATFIDEKGQQIVVYSDPIGNAHYYNSVFEVAECYYDPHNAATLELNELVYIKQVYETKYEEVMPEDVLPRGTNSASAFNPQEGGADVESDKMRNMILECKTDVDPDAIPGTVYYISPNGDDANNGTSPETAWKSVDAINLHADDIQNGDAVLFERGGLYRSVISLKDERLGTDVAYPTVSHVIQAKSGVTYGAYGSGDKPLIYASYKNYAWGDYWEKVVDENGVRIWKVNTPYSDAGSVVFDHGKAVGIKRFAYDAFKYDEDGDGTKESTHAYPITKDNYIKHLENDYEYFHDHRNGVLYLRLDAGCPSELYKDIEICTRNDIFKIPMDSKDVMIDNLALKYSGHFGIGIKERTENVVIQNCEIGWIGGCQFKFTEATDNNGKTTCYSEASRVGNAVEFWETTTNSTVQNNWVYQAFDAGLSPQGINGGVYTNITMCNNLVEYCSYNIEWFDRNGEDPEGSSPSRWDNYCIKDNILRFAGYGWGRQRQDAGRAASNICGWSYVYNTPLNISIQNNTFDCSAKNTVYWYWSGDTTYEDTLKISGNTFYEKASSENQAIYYGSYGKQLYATNQKELEEAIKCFDSNPKRVKWLYDDHYIFDAGDLD